MTRTGLIILVLVLGLLLANTVSAATIAVIGTGRVGSALGPRLADLGHTVIYGSRNPSGEAVQKLVGQSPNTFAATSTEAAARAEFIVLAIPWRAAEAVVQGFEGVEGKVVIDVTNALTMAEDGLMTMAVASSAGELIQEWLPDSHVVKAFNAVGYRVMADPQVAGGPVTIPIAGNSAEAKAEVETLIRQLGFSAMDVGPIRNARHLEGMAVIYMVPYLSGRRADAFEYYFRQSESLQSDRAVRPAQ